MEKQKFNLKYIISELLNRDEGDCWMSEKELDEYRTIKEFGDVPRFNVISDGEYFAIYINNGQIPNTTPLVAGIPLKNSADIYFSNEFSEEEVFDGEDWNEDFFAWLEGKKSGYATLEAWGKIK